MKYRKSGAVQTWGDVVELVQKANINQIRDIKWRENHRKIAYKNQLDLQVQQHLRSHVIENQRKSREKTELQQSIDQEKMQMNLKKIKKLKTQQKFQQENLQLLKNTKNSLFKSIKATTVEQQQSQNPFVLLVDQQDLRKKQTIQNFKLQNRLNNRQIQIKNKRYSQEVENDKIMDKQYQNHVKNQFETIEKQRQRFKNKYLALRNWQKQKLKSYDRVSNGSIEKSYRQFLNSQAEQLKLKHKYKQKTDAINPVQSKINQNASTTNSSPAYLGRIPFSDDRKKQLSMLDQTLFNGSKYQNSNVGNINSNNSRGRREQFLYRSVDITPKNDYKNSFINNNKVGEKVNFGREEKNRQIQQLNNLNLKLKTEMKSQNQLPAVEKRAFTVLQKPSPISASIIAPPAPHSLHNPQIKTRIAIDPKIIQKQQRNSINCNANPNRNTNVSSNSTHSPRSFMRFDVIAGCNKIIVI